MKLRGIIDPNKLPPHRDNKAITIQSSKEKLRNNTAAAAAEL